MLKNPNSLAGHQRGISLVMSLIMLVVLTMIAASATYSTNSSIRIVGNMQMQDEALTAAQLAIDQHLNLLTNFTTPAGASVDVDLNRDNQKDYTVTVSAPVCISTAPKGGNSVEAQESAEQITFWDFTAQVEDTRTGAKMTVNQGIKINLFPGQGCV